MGVPVKLIAKLTGVTEKTVYNHVHKDGGDTALLKTTTEVMERLATDYPAEWLKRFSDRDQFVSVDRMQIEVDVDVSDVAEGLTGLQQIAAEVAAFRERESDGEPA